MARPREQWAAAPRAAALAALLFLCAAAAAPRAAAQPRQMPRAGPKDCGEQGQKCCPKCMPDVPLTACDQWSCADGAQCYMFANKAGIPPDGGDGYPMVCLTAPKCGGDGQACCFNSDPASEDRCAAGLTCIAEGVVTYASNQMYQQLTADNNKTSDPAVMGTCKRVTAASCGKLWGPCGGAAAKLGCAGEALTCAPGAFCASPGDTRLGAPRCLPLPSNCGKLGGPCCPANRDTEVREKWFFDRKTPVPFCDEGRTMCVWDGSDYKRQGLGQFPEFTGGQPYKWDGYFQRGYGRSRCIALPTSCGGLGEACCPSMMDERISGMVHNRNFPFQPCNYKLANQTGMFCKGHWQGSLLKEGALLGVCTNNVEDCGLPGRPCCFNDIPEIGAVGSCKFVPGVQHFCNESSVCEQCPAVATISMRKTGHCWASYGARRLHGIRRLELP